MCDNYINLGKAAPIFRIIVFRITIDISDLFKHFTIFRSVRYICIFSIGRDKRLYERELDIRIDKIFKDATCPQTVMGNIRINEIWKKIARPVYVQRVYESISLWKTYMCTRWNRIIGINIDFALFLRTYLQAAIINN